jgi:hypothetical protein
VSAFRRKLLPQSSGRMMLIHKDAEAASHPENGVNSFLRHVGISTYYTLYERPGVA